MRPFCSLVYLIAGSADSACISASFATFSATFSSIWRSCSKYSRSSYSPPKNSFGVGGEYNGLFLFRAMTLYSKVSAAKASLRSLLKRLSVIYPMLRLLSSTDSEVR